MIFRVDFLQNKGGGHTTQRNWRRYWKNLVQAFPDTAWRHLLELALLSVAEKINSEIRSSGGGGGVISYHTGDTRPWYTASCVP